MATGWSEGRILRPAAEVVMVLEAVDYSPAVAAGVVVAVGSTAVGVAGMIEARGATHHVRKNSP